MGVTISVLPFKFLFRVIKQLIWFLTDVLLVPPWEAYAVQIFSIHQPIWRKIKKSLT